MLAPDSVGNSIKGVITVLTRVTENCQSGNLEHSSTPCRNPNQPQVLPITLKMLFFFFIRTVKQLIKV